VRGFAGTLPRWAHIAEMTTRNVAAAVAAIERGDPALGDWAQVAADGLIAGEGEETLCQAFVQDFLWYRLPTKYPQRALGPIARASESLLRELRLERYASIAGSDMTGIDPRGVARG